METTATTNGVFGAKIMGGYLDNFLRALEIGAGRRIPLEEIFPRLSYVFLTRRDRVAQAVSWWRAQQTGQWVSGLEAAREPHYDFAGIDECYNSIVEGERRWIRLFQRTGMPVLGLEYEEVVNDPRGAVSSVLDHVGVPTADGLEFDRPDLARQADALSRSWVTRYLQERNTKTKPELYVPEGLTS
jgi:LPS sulfotransferase NodH